MGVCLKLMCKSQSASKILYLNIKISLFKIIVKFKIKSKSYYYKEILYIAIGMKLRNNLYLILTNM